jgi:hypothetical protein
MVSVLVWRTGYREFNLNAQALNLINVGGEVCLSSA